MAGVDERMRIPPGSRSAVSRPVLPHGRQRESARWFGEANIMFENSLNHV